MEAQSPSELVVCVYMLQLAFICVEEYICLYVHKVYWDYATCSDLCITGIILKGSSVTNL